MNSQSLLSFIIHGFTADADDDWVFNMTEALLHQRKRYQVTAFIGISHLGSRVSSGGGTQSLVWTLSNMLKNSFR